MVSVADLLNPAPSPEPPRVPLPASRPAPIPPPARRTVSFRDEPNHARPSIDTLRMAEHVKNSARCKPKGVVNFPPFEALDEGSLREVRRFQVYPFGSIQDTCRRIPYNSGKKDFFTKTGREFFEVFQYEFKVPGDDISYTVMWDYSVGLVRMTPFFKCLGYSKTTPAKMLSQNPGLKDVTYSITGGAIKAQGYWMPFSCAKAVCATFCHKIAGALIPLFGPRFPSECVHEKATGHGRMVIDPEIVARAKRDAAALFGPRTTALPSPRASRSASPHPLSLSKPYESPADYQRGVLLSPYGTDTDLDYHPGPYPAVPPLRTAGRPPSAAPTLTPLHSPGWTAVNQRHPPVHPYYPRSAAAQVNDEHPWNAGPTANPWLSAVPRSPTPATSSRHEQQQRPRPYHARFHYQTSSSSRFFDGPTLPPLRGGKRGYEQVDETAIDNKHGNDEEYDAGESHAGSSSSPLTAVSDEQEPHHDHHVKKEDAKAGPELAVASTKTAARATAAAETATPTSPEPRTPSVGQSSLDHPESTSSRSPLHAAVRVGVSSPGPEAVSRNRNPARDDSGHNQARRPAAERDAAIMLMHMMRGQDDDDDDNDNNTTNNSNSRDGGARAISQGQGQGCHHGQSEGDASPATCVSSVGVGASAIASARPAVVPTPSPPAPSTVHHHHTRTAAAAAAASSSPPGAGGGPCTRAKRRRTLM